MTCAITRMVQTRPASAIIMRLSGRTQHATFARYVNPDAGAVVEVAAALDAFNSEAAGGRPAAASELIN